MKSLAELIVLAHAASPRNAYVRNVRVFIAALVAEVAR